jgi:phosphatidylglycerophosphate synthase
MVRTGPLTALLGQALLLALLAETVGLSWVGWLVGSTTSVVTNALLVRGLVRTGAVELGPANRVTLARATLVGGVAALIATALVNPSLIVTALVATALTGDVSVHPAAVVAIVVLSTAALLLDAVDGRVARRTGSVSRVGARFDMEVDAFLILVLSWYVATTVGGWVLAIGLARYAFVGAGLLWPWLRRPSPARPWCKVVAALQGIVLTVAVADVVSDVVRVTFLAVSLALLGESFGREAWWLWRSRRSTNTVDHGRPELAGVR